MSDTPGVTAAVAAIALLDEPVRRSLYDWVATQGDAVGRDEAAHAAGVSRSLAAFHLDRLAAAGLLEVTYRRLSGRSGPGAGRPAKLYRRPAGDIAISLPDRRYATAARLFAAALENGAVELPPPALREVAQAEGRAIGADARSTDGPRAGRRRRRVALTRTLHERGYEPRALADGTITLANCPFDSLVAEHRDLVCGMNLAVAEGILGGLGDTGLRASLEPAPGRCCVVLRSQGSASTPAP